MDGQKADGRMGRGSVALATCFFSMTAFLLEKLVLNAAHDEIPVAAIASIAKPLDSQSEATSWKSVEWNSVSNDKTTLFRDIMTS